MLIILPRLYAGIPNPEVSMFCIEQEEMIQLLHDQERLLKIQMLLGSELDDPEIITLVSQLLCRR